MKWYDYRMLQQMLGMSSNEDVLERILGILEEKQHGKMEKHGGISNHIFSRFLEGGPQ